MQQLAREREYVRIRALEEALVTRHHRSITPAKRREASPPAPVDAEEIRQRLSRDAGISELEAELGGGNEAPVAPERDPVDRYPLIRKHRREALAGIKRRRVRERRAARADADELAHQHAEHERQRREEDRVQEQRQLDAAWEELQRRRTQLESDVEAAVSAEESRRREAQAKQQAQMDTSWERLTSNHPAAVTSALSAALGDNEVSAIPVRVRQSTAAIAVRFPWPDVVPDKKTAVTPSGKSTLHKRNKSEVNRLYVEALGSHVLAAVRTVLASAPGIGAVEVLVVRGTAPDDLKPIYWGSFDGVALRAA